MQLTKLGNPSAPRGRPALPVPSRMLGSGEGDARLQGNRDSAGLASQTRAPRRPGTAPRPRPRARRPRPPLRREPPPQASGALTQAGGSIKNILNSILDCLCSFIPTLGWNYKGISRGVCVHGFRGAKYKSYVT